MLCASIRIWREKTNRAAAGCVDAPAGIFGDSSKCGMLHGKMEAEEKALTLERFKR